MTLPKPLVTVVVPLHNYGRFVVETIQSVQAQTMNNFECFIINDASTDDSETIAREAVKDDARFHVLNANFKNLSATRNYGISQGTAPYICCIDSDDKLGNENFFEVLISALQKDRTIGIAYTSLTVMDENGVLGHKPDWPPPEFDADAQYNHINQMPTCNVFLREAWKRAGGYRPYYCMVEDAELWTTMIDIGYSAQHVVQDGWFHYRLHNKSASQVHRTGEIPEPDWLEYHPWAKDMQRPFASGGRPPRGSWPVRFYNEPDVTVIIPVGAGHEETVKDALHSLEGQTFRYWECIVVQDSAVKPDLSGFPWARLLATKGYEGAGVARNLGAEAAQSPFLVFLDADDMLKPAFLERALAAYKQHGRYIYTDFLTHDKMTNWQVHPTPDYTFEAIKAKPAMHPVTSLIPKQWFVDVGGFDEELPCFEDTDFFMKMMVKGHCGYHLPEPLLIYNLDSGTRRIVGEGFEKNFKALLKTRYGAYMENNTMCNCIDPPKGKQPMAPSPDNAADFKEAYGDMILAQLVGKFVAEAPVTFRGPATRVDYGRRAKGDIFYIWQADLENSGDTFKRVENYSTEPEPTIVPEPPPELEPLPEGFQELSIEQKQEIVEALFEPLPVIDDVPEVAPTPKVSTPKAATKPKAAVTNGKSSIHRAAQAKSKGKK